MLSEASEVAGEDSRSAHHFEDNWGALASMQVIWKKANSPRKILPRDFMPETRFEAIATEFYKWVKTIDAARKNDMKLTDYQERLAKEDLDLLKHFLQKTVSEQEADENRLKSTDEIARCKTQYADVSIHIRGRSTYRTQRDI